MSDGVIRRTPLKEAALMPGSVDAVTSDHAALLECLDGSDVEAEAVDLWWKRLKISLVIMGS
jgi:hypothetical protein